MLSFKQVFSLSSFTFIRRLFSSSLLYAVRVVSSALSEVIDIFPSNVDSSLYFILAFHMMYSAYKLNKQGNSIQLYSFLNFEPVRCSMFGPNCCFLAYIQISQETGKVVWYSHLLKNFPVCVIRTVKGLGIDNFFWNSLAFSMIQWILEI